MANLTWQQIAAKSGIVITKTGNLTSVSVNKPLEVAIPRIVDMAIKQERERVCEILKGNGMDKTRVYEVICGVERKE